MSARPFPFWVLQVTELVVAVILVDVSVHVGGGGLLVAAAAVLAGLAVTAQGPLGLLRVCPQRLHVALVVGAAVLIAAAPVVPAVRPDVEGIIVVEFAAIGVIRVATLTRTSASPASIAGAGRAANPVIETTAAIVEPGPPDRATSPSPPAESPPAESSPAESPPAESPPADSAAQRAGRTAGAAAASGRRLWARHRPTVESRTKEVVRRAGRWAGKAAGPPGGSGHTGG